MSISTERILERLKNELEECVNVFARLGDEYHVASGYTNLVSAYEQLGQKGEAERSAEKALALHRKLGNKVGIVAGLGALARILRENAPERAASALREALELSQHIEATPLAASLYEDLAKVEAGRGQVSEADRLFLEAIGMRKPLGNVPGIVRCYGQLVKLRRFRGDRAGAWDAGKKAFDLCIKAGRTEDARELKRWLEELSLWQDAD